MRTLVSDIESSLLDYIPTTIITAVALRARFGPCQRSNFETNDDGAVFSLSHPDAAVKPEETVNIRLSRTLDAEPAGVKVMEIHPYVAGTLVFEVWPLAFLVSRSNCCLPPVASAWGRSGLAAYFMSHLAFAERRPN